MGFVLFQFLEDVELKAQARDFGGEIDVDLWT